MIDILALPIGYWHWMMSVVSFLESIMDHMVVQIPHGPFALMCVCLMTMVPLASIAYIIARLSGVSDKDMDEAYAKYCTPEEFMP